MWDDWSHKHAGVEEVNRRSLRVGRFKRNFLIVVVGLFIVGFLIGSVIQFVDEEKNKPNRTPPERPPIE